MRYRRANVVRWPPRWKQQATLQTVLHFLPCGIGWDGRPKRRCLDWAPMAIQHAVVFCRQCLWSEGCGPVGD